MYKLVVFFALLAVAFAAPGYLGTPLAAPVAYAAAPAIAAPIAASYAAPIAPVAYAGHGLVRTAYFG